MGSSLEFDDGNFETEVIQAEEPVLVDFSATWCGPCQQLSPIIDELAEEYSGKVKVGKVDIDKAGISIKPLFEFPPFGWRQLKADLKSPPNSSIQ